MGIYFWFFFLEIWGQRIPDVVVLMESLVAYCCLPAGEWRKSRGKNSEEMERLSLLPSPVPWLVGFFFFFASKQLNLLFAQGQLPAGDGTVDKVYPAPSSISSILCVSRSVMSDSATPWTVAHQAPLSKGFSRQEYRSGLPFPSPCTLLPPNLSLSILYLKLFTL